MSLRAAIFDLDGTLIEQEAAADRAVEQWARLVGGETHDAAARWRQIATPHYARYQRREITWQEQRRERVREFLGRELDAEEADRLFAMYLPLYEEGWSLYPDAIPCLTRARAAGLIVAVLTNGERGQQMGKIDRFGLSEHLDHIVCSSDLPVGKPDRRAYDEAVSLVGVRAEEALMIGDSLCHDVHAARYAGLRSVFLNRSGASVAADVPSVGSLDEVAFG